MEHKLFKYMTEFTSLRVEQQQAIMEDIQIKEYKKGTVLLTQEDVPRKCYFVLKGCIRQYSINEEGKEFTSNFYTEDQAIANFNRYKKEKQSEYYLTCLEDCILVVGDLDTEEKMYKKYAGLETMTRKMVEKNLGEVQDEFAEFIATTPEKRFKTLLQKRPELINRVPQYQLASYLGMTPESLSRIKKRVSDGKVM
ncbi:Crp/Fnr family transcriptional regulator [Bacillus carboniphilus]|uniref:Crp/Fnr family transcriptional regulator n=1 Tax=Bacillus carboniphilus TaxID=86663 RepID=A0ABY9JWK6_9BACI|nr:Crp/Fnr family transcriptional regulator [Bacillus carboniphilus]WLR42061.1 Crp/Fnr family transcriptional regulator [Bacillus carboniphilus]